MWQKIRSHKWIAALDNFLRGMNRLNLSTYAAASSFYIILSLAPLAVLVCSLLPYTPLSRTMLENWLSNYMPDVLSQVLEIILNQVYRSSAAVLSVSLLFTLYSASKGISSVIQGLGQSTGDPLGQNFFRRRFLACLWTVAFLLCLVIAATLLVFGRHWFRWDFGALWMTLLRWRFLVALPLLTGLFLLLYRLFSSLRLPFFYLLPGSLFSAVGWLVFSWAFSVYNSLGSGVSLYGSLAGLVIAMLWIYYCLYILMVGQYLNFYLMDHHKKKKRW